MVWVDGVKGTFRVAKVDHAQGTADVESTSGEEKVQMHLPFHAIHALGEQVNQGALRSRGNT